MTKFFGLNISRLFIHCIVISIVIIAFVFVIGESGILKPVERVLVNIRFRFRNTPAIDPELLLVLSNSTTFEKYGYPLSRRYYGIIANTLCESKSKAVIFDHTFASTVDSAGDTMFAHAIKEHNNIACAWYSPLKMELHKTNPGIVPLKYALPEPIYNSAFTPYETSLSWDDVSLPYDEALQNLEWLGNISVERSDYIDKIPLLVKHGENIYPSISLVAACITLNIKLSDIIVKSGSIILPTDNGSVNIPVDQKARIIVNYIENKSNLKQFSLHNVYESILSDDLETQIERFEDKIVFLGISDITSGVDMHITPFGNYVPGVAIHLIVLNSILQGQFIYNAPLYVGIIMLIICVFCISYFQMLLSPKAGLICLIIILSFISITAFVIFQFCGLIMNMSEPITGVLFAFAGTAFYNEIMERKRIKNIKHIFGKYVSQEIMDQIILEDNGLVPMSEQNVTILFVDISDHSNWIRKLSYSELSVELNQCLGEMIQAVFEHGGIINRFMGDGMMILYNTPIKQDDHVSRAVKSGIAIQEHISRLNEKRTEQSNHKILVRVGINTGNALAGTLGNKERLDYTVIGDVVNMAKRAEEQCEPGQITITDSVFYVVNSEFLIEPIGPKPVKGRESGLMLYRVISVR